MSRSRRLFFALWPPAALQRSIAEQTRAYLEHCGGRMIGAEKLHITLAFYGQVDEDSIACLTTAADNVASEPFSLSLSHFDYWYKPRVAWLGPQIKPDALMALVEQLNHQLQACGYTPEHFPYVPHMTLVRKARRAPKQTEIKAIDWPVDCFALVESVSVDGGVRYDVLRQWPLAVEK